VAVAILTVSVVPVAQNVADVKSVAEKTVAVTTETVSGPAWIGVAQRSWRH
jgi:hypothetical protein